MLISDEDSIASEWDKTCWFGSSEKFSDGTFFFPRKFLARDSMIKVSSHSELLQGQHDGRENLALIRIFRGKPLVLEYSINYTYLAGFWLEDHVEGERSEFIPFLLVNLKECAHFE